MLRAADRWIGTPVVAAFALAPKRRPPDPATIRRIGVYKSAAIGDTLLLAGTFDALRLAFPAARLTLITGRDNAAAAAFLDREIDEHVVVPSSRPLATIRAVRALRLDVLLDCGPWPRVDALVAALSGARSRIGFRVPGMARHHAFDRVVDHSSAIHQLENFRNLARAAGARVFSPPSLVAPPMDSRPFVKPAKRYVVFHPWSGGYMGSQKEWPAERWAELALLLRSHEPVAVLVSGGPDDSEPGRALADQLILAGVDATNIAGAHSLTDLAHILLASQLVVSVNTGIMHLAALLGVPTVSLDGPTPAARWGPIGPRVRSVSPPGAGCGFLDLGFEYAGHRDDCMDAIEASAVFRAAVELLGA